MAPQKPMQQHQMAERRTFRNVAVTKVCQRTKHRGPEFFIMNRDIYCPGKLLQDGRTARVGDVASTVAVFSNVQGQNKWRGTEVKWAATCMVGTCKSGAGPAAQTQLQVATPNKSQLQHKRQATKHFENVKVTMINKHKNFFIVTPDVYCSFSKLVPDGTSINVGDVLPRVIATFENGKR
jgi:hypothetical protein